MRQAFPLCIVAALAACGPTAEENDSQPQIVANIVEDAVPAAGEDESPSNQTQEAENRAEGEGRDASSADAIPASLQGSWTGMSDRCGDRAAVMELTVRRDSLIFHESVGQVEAVSRGENGAIRVTAAFTGEGDSWTRTLTLKPSGDTLTIVNDGTATTRKRC